MSHDVMIVCIVMSCDVIGGSCDPCRTLQATAHLLPPPPSLEGVVSVSDWLESLHLSQLVDKFQGFTLRKIANMWDIELTSVSHYIII